MVGLTYGKLNQRLDATNTNTAGTATWIAAASIVWLVRIRSMAVTKFAAVSEQTKNDYDRASVSTS